MGTGSSNGDSQSSLHIPLDTPLHHHTTTPPLQSLHSTTGHCFRRPRVPPSPLEPADPVRPPPRLSARAVFDHLPSTQQCPTVHAKEVANAPTLLSEYSGYLAIDNYAAHALPGLKPPPSRAPQALPSRG